MSRQLWLKIEIQTTTGAAISGKAQYYEIDGNVGVVKITPLPDDDNPWQGLIIVPVANIESMIVTTHEEDDAQ